MTLNSFIVSLFSESEIIKKVPPTFIGLQTILLLKLSFDFLLQGLNGNFYTFKKASNKKLSDLEMPNKKIVVIGLDFC